MLSNIELLKSGNSEINFPYNLNIKDSDFQSAWDAFVMDRPEYFFLDTTNVSLVIRKTTILNKVKINYKELLRVRGIELLMVLINIAICMINLNMFMIRLLI